MISMERYKNIVTQSSKYFALYGMVEKRSAENATFSAYNTSINSDIYTWRQYNFGEVYENEHHLYALNLNLSDVKI